MTGSIKPGRAPGSWYLRVDVSKLAGKRRQQRETFRGTKREAERRLRDLIREVENGGVDTREITLPELAEKWLSSTQARVGARTYARYKQLIDDHVIPTLGSARAADLRPVQIEDALRTWRETPSARLNRPLSSRSIRHAFDALRAMYRWSVRMGIVPRNPCDAVTPPRWEQGEMKALDASGVADLLTAASGTGLEIPIAVLVGTGVRRGELFGLRWSDVDLDAGRVTVRRSVEIVDGVRHYKPPKTSRSNRTLSLAAFVVEALRRQKTEQEERRKVRGLEAGGDSYIFDRADAEPWNPDSFSWAFAELVRKKELSKVRLHDLRHSHATIALAAGTDLKTISAALGHSNISVTANTYLHATEAMQRTHADRLDAVLGVSITGALKPVERPETPVPQPCHKGALATKKPLQSKGFVVAPTGFETVARGSPPVMAGRRSP